MKLYWIIKFLKTIFNKILIIKHHNKKDNIMENKLTQNHFFSIKLIKKNKNGQMK